MFVINSNFSLFKSKCCFHNKTVQKYIFFHKKGHFFFMKTQKKSCLFFCFLIVFPGFQAEDHQHGNRDGGTDTVTNRT